LQSLHRKALLASRKILSLPSALPLTREGHSVDFGSLGALIYGGFPTLIDGCTDLFGREILCR
jgi:hypothetical protein